VKRRVVQLTRGGSEDRQMKGVSYLVDRNGERTGVLIDLKKNTRLWEDLCDAALARRRAREPRETLACVKRRLRRAGKLSG
jgi:hypothetical protein